MPHTISNVVELQFVIPKVKKAWFHSYIIHKYMTKYNAKTHSNVTKSTGATEKLWKCIC